MQDLAHRFTDLPELQMPLASLAEPVDPLQLVRQILMILAMVQYMGINAPEVKSLKDGEYVGMLRFTQILERGP